MPVLNRTNNFQQALYSFPENKNILFTNTLVELQFLIFKMYTQVSKKY